MDWLCRWLFYITVTVGVCTVAEGNDSPDLRSRENVDTALVLGVRAVMRL